MTINLTKQFAIPIAAALFFAASVLTACSNDPLASPIEDMEHFYGESLELKAVASDSIQRFATKVETYVYKNPEERSNPYYPEIVDNIKVAAQACNLNITITINTEWEGVIEIQY